MLTFNSENQIVRKGNQLIEARYRLSLGEQRLILLLVSQIEPQDEDFKDYEIRVQDFIHIFGLQSDKSIYEKIEQSANDLVGKQVVLKNSEEKEITTWLSYVKYKKGSGIVQLRFDKSLKPYLLQLKESFTQYNLSFIIKFKSQYSIRLYEVLKKEARIKEKYKHARVFEKTFELEEYRLLLGVEKGAYPIFSAFRKWVIGPPVYEISEQTDLTIRETKYIKTGLKVTAICFVVEICTEEEIKAKRKEQQNEVLNKKEETLSGKQTLINELIELGYSFEAARRDVNEYGIKRIKINIAYTKAKKEEKIKKGESIDFPAYLAKSIQNNFGESWEFLKRKEEEKRKKQQEEEEEKLKNEKRIEKEESELNDKAINDFFLLKNEERTKILSDFLNSITPIMRKTPERLLKERGENSLKEKTNEMKSTRALFSDFLRHLPSH
jgi:plasmid replication initiation protein